LFNRRATATIADGVDATPHWEASGDAVMGGKMLIRIGVAAALAVFGLCAHGSTAAASCKIVTFAQEGVWHAYGGPCENGPPMCGVATSGTGKFFGLKYFRGDQTVTIQLGAGDWKIKDGAKQAVTMEIDNYDVWSATATGFHFDDGDAGLEYQIRTDQLNEFIREFRGGDELILRFPGANDVEAWNTSLRGSDRISTSFISCIQAM